MSLMRCPACHTSYGGPTLAAFACCPLCLAEDGRIERLVYDDDDAPPPPSPRGRRPATRRRPAPAGAPLAAPAGRRAARAS